MNLSFSFKDGNDYSHDIRTQRNTFLRLTKQIEDILNELERSTVNPVSDNLIFFASLNLESGRIR
jgi:hypothetical protein